MLPIATRPTTAAAMASAVSSPLTVALAAGVTARCCGCAAGWRWETGADVAVRGAGAAAGAAWEGAGAADNGMPLAPVGPPGGSVGNLMVGAAEGFGGRLMRTVSFLGWTLPVSFFGGMAPAGTFGMFSAIKSETKIGGALGLSNSNSNE